MSWSACTGMVIFTIRLHPIHVECEEFCQHFPLASFVSLLHCHNVDYKGKKHSLKYSVEDSSYPTGLTRD